MDAARQREIASKGGQSVPNEKRSFSQNRQLAAEAGRKGGQASHGGRSKAGTARASARSAAARQREPQRAMDETGTPASGPSVSETDVAHDDDGSRAGATH
jgi:general stress protein YciG